MTPGDRTAYEHRIEHARSVITSGLDWDIVEGSAGRPVGRRVRG